MHFSINEPRTPHHQLCGLQSVAQCARHSYSGWPIDAARHKRVAPAYSELLAITFGLEQLCDFMGR